MRYSTTPLRAASAVLGLVLGWSGVAGAATHVLSGMDPSRVYDVMQNDVVVASGVQPTPDGVLTIVLSGSGNFQIFENGQGDVQPPGTILDLVAEGTDTTSVSLSWTAPGDDGQAGQAAAYEIRWATESSDLLSNPNFDPDPPSPSPGGATETHLLTNLPSGSSIFIAIRARDDVGLWSALSNVASATTGGEEPPPEEEDPPDFEAPAQIPDVSLSNLQPRSIHVNWIATGDDGMNGRATAYDLRVATFPLDADNFDEADAVWGLPEPLPASEPEEFTVRGLLPDIEYHVAIIAIDDVGNRSPVSESVNARTMPGDTAPLLPPDSPLARFVADAIEVTWPRSPDAAVAGYYIYRAVEGGDRERLIPLPTTATRYIDTDVVPEESYAYQVTSVDGFLNESPYSPEIWVKTTVGVAPQVYVQAYPNPVRTEAVFRFAVPEEADGATGEVPVTLDIYDVAGRRVARVVQDTFAPGDRQVRWSTMTPRGAMMPGVYVALLQAGSVRTVNRFAIAR